MHHLQVRSFTLSNYVRFLFCTTHFNFSFPYLCLWKDLESRKINVKSKSNSSKASNVTLEEGGLMQGLQQKKMKITGCCPAHVVKHHPERLRAFQNTINEAFPLPIKLFD